MTDIATRAEQAAPDEARHTPGPWSQYYGDPLIIVDALGSSLGDMSPGDPFISHATAIANARLTSAAPDLLHLVQRLAKITPHRTIDPTSPIYREMIAAISKAIGDGV